MGSPMDGDTLRLWGLPVVLSTGMTENTAGVCDTSMVTIFENGSTTVEVSSEHSTFFTERKIAINMWRRFGASEALP